MSHLLFPPVGRNRCGLVVLSLALAFAVDPPGALRAQSDDFDDGNIDGWTVFDPLGDLTVAPPAEVTFPDGGVRLKAFAPAIPDAGPARVFIYRDEDYSTFYAAVDFTDWDDEINQAIGLLLRATNIGLGMTDGYVMNYDPNQTDSRPGGQLQFNLVAFEAEAGTIAAANVTFIKGRSYRWVVRGEGNELHGAVYDHEDLNNPIVEIMTDQGDAHPEGKFGLFNFYRDDSTDPIGNPDMTIDNYFIAAANPAEDILPGTPHPVAGTAQAVLRTPASGANFYPAGDGIALTATTRGGAALAPGDVQISLNGVDVTGSAQVVQNGPDLDVTFDGLEPNQVYDAVVTVGDPAAGGSVSRWNFDTVEVAKLADKTFREIEAEDYDYESGMFQDDPPPSGWGDGGLINGSGVGYYDLIGEPGIDFFDFDVTADAANDYRFFDGVGLRMGSDDIEPYIDLITDTVRPKYESTGAPDYEVFRTEATEWLNYTRDFEAGDYRILLRAASREAQDVILQDVTGGGSTELGRFKVPNLVSPVAHRFIPLTDAGGEGIVVNLDGERTLRMLMDGADGDFETMFTLYLNYLLLIPASDPGPDPVSPVVSNVTRDGSGSVAITWSSSAGVEYAVDYSRSLGAAPDTWTEIASVTATGESTSFTDDDAARNAEPDGQYRVRVKE